MTTRTDAAAVLGRAAASTRAGRLPEKVRDHTALLFIDVLASMAVGSGRHAHERTRELFLSAPGGTGPATVLGRVEGASAAEAIVLNATLPTVYQLDEGHRVSRGHPAIHIVPTALATAEAGGAGVPQLLAAVAAGYEVAARVGMALGGTVPEIHPHGNWGAIGAAVAAAHLMADGEEKALVNAIDIAAGLVGYHDRRPAREGAGTHHLWAAVGAHTGFLAATAAVAGMTGVPGVLETAVLPRAGAAPQPDLLHAGRTADGEWARWTVMENYVKFWPACAHTHTAIGATLELLRKENVSAGDIESIDITTFRAAAVLDDPAPRTELAARFSIPAVVAAAILDQSFGLESISEARLKDPAWRALAGRVSVQHDPVHDEGYPDRGRPLVMRVRLGDGRVLRHHALRSHGDPESPASADEVQGKARRLFAHRFGSAAAARIMAEATGLAGATELTGLVEALRAAARTGR